MNLNLIHIHATGNGILPISHGNTVGINRTLGTLMMDHMSNVGGAAHITVEFNSNMGAVNSELYRESSVIGAA